MVGRRSFPDLVRLVHRIGRPRPWAGPAIIGLGLLAALLEGIGLLLFIPLIQSLGAPADAGGRLQRIFERLLLPIPPEQLTFWIVVVLCFTILLKNLVSFANAAVTRHMDGDVAHRLRARIFDQTLSSCIDYAAAAKRADISTTLTSNSWRVATALTLFYSMAIAVVTFIVFIGLMAVISPLLTFCAMLFLAGAAGAIRFATRKADSIGRAVVSENKQFGLRMWESLNGLQLIRAFGRENYERDRFISASDTVRRRLLSLDLLWALPGRISEVAVVILIGALILTAGLAGVGIAALAAFLSLLYRLQGPTRELMESKVAVDGLTGSIEDVAELLDLSDRPFLADGDRAARPLGSGIVFENVSFRYAPGDPWALKDVSFEIPAGTTTAIVGASGAGKSTIVALLCRFYDPQFGAVRADGVPLSELRLADWRGQLSLMSQDVQLFNDTVAANIGYGRIGATRAEIASAARIAHANTFIEELPNGYDTIVGDQGFRLSGGQRQRIALARAILRDPDLLLLDEATNSLDVDSEQAFQLALERYSDRRTVVVIAHRLSTVRNADQVIVMGGGKVIEMGPPERLLRNDGHFARMLGLQQPLAQEHG